MMETKNGDFSLPRLCEGYSGHSTAFEAFKTALCQASKLPKTPLNVPQQLPRATCFQAFKTAVGQASRLPKTFQSASRQLPLLRRSRLPAGQASKLRQTHPHASQLRPQATWPLPRPRRPQHSAFKAFKTAACQASTLPKSPSCFSAASTSYFFSGVQCQDCRLPGLKNCLKVPTCFAAASTSDLGHSFPRATPLPRPLF